MTNEPIPMKRKEPEPLQLPVSRPTFDEHIRKIVKQEVRHTLYDLLRIEGTEISIATMTYEEFEAFCDRVMSEA